MEATRGRSVVAAAVVLIGMAAAVAQADTTIDTDQTSFGMSHGLLYIKATSQLVGSGESRGAAAECPDRDMLKTSGGGAVVQGTSGVPFDDSAPTHGFSRARAWVATFTNESGGQQVIHSWAVCGRLDGRELRQSTVEDAPGGTEVVVKARCPSGTKVTGGGVSVSGVTSQSRTSAPFDAGDDDLKPDDGWEVIAYPDQIADVSAFALCARGAFGYRTDTLGPFPNSTLAFPQATCESSESVTGGGVRIGGTSPEARISHSSPADGFTDPDQVPDDRWDSGVEIPQGETATGFAICKK